MPGDKRRLSDVAWVFVGRVVLVSLVPLGTCSLTSWNEMSTAVAENQREIQSMKLLGFTQDQAAALEARIMLKLESPPRWLTDAVLRLEKAAERMDDQVTAMNTRLVRIESKISEEKR